MFSNDRNVETISQLVDVCKHYIGLQTEYVKLDVIEKVVRLITVLTLALSLTIVLVLALIYVSFAAAYALEPHVGLPFAFLIISGCYLFTFVLFFLFRKQWIQRPIVKFLASLLMEN